MFKAVAKCCKRSYAARFGLSEISLSSCVAVPKAVRPRLACVQARLLLRGDTEDEDDDRQVEDGDEAQGQEQHADVGEDSAYWADQVGGQGHTAAGGSPMRVDSAEHHVHGNGVL